MKFEERLREHFIGLDGKEFVPAVEAVRFLNDVAAKHPKEMTDWLSLHAEYLIRQKFSQWDRTVRETVLRDTPKRLFAEAAEAFEQSGSPDDFECILGLRFAVDERHKRKPLGEMVGHECEFAAGGYGKQGRAALAMEAFLLAVGKKAGQNRVDSVISETECGRLLQSFLPPHEQALAVVA